ncbi:MAG: D-tyrosyl-tRNA(Tyr) deacylase [Deltaproteobacteria bacterium]|nr:D-tyrosyl-tRNA(Tyr) deacylase [Deltaproteobacteria bacterium]
MKAVAQRVDFAKVSVDDKVVGQIGKGLLVLLGVEADDQKNDAEYIAGKLVNLRIFEDRYGKMNVSLIDISGEMLVVSQFTLLADCNRGRRPSFVNACQPEEAVKLYEYFVELVSISVKRLATGKFQEMMKIDLCNNGPVTLILDSRKRRGKRH